MSSDNSSHSESEFYYPEKLKFFENEPVSASTSHNNLSNVNNGGEITNDIQDFIQSKRPENTLKKTKYDMNIWKRYFEAENELRYIENMWDLNVHICRLLMQVKKRHGTAYEPNTLTCFSRNDQNSMARNHGHH